MNNNLSPCYLFLSSNLPGQVESSLDAAKQAESDASLGVFNSSGGMFLAIKRPKSKGTT